MGYRLTIRTRMEFYDPITEKWEFLMIDDPLWLNEGEIVKIQQGFYDRYEVTARIVEIVARTGEGIIRLSLRPLYTPPVF